MRYANRIRSDRSLKSLRSGLLALVCSVALASCGTPTTTPAPAPPAAAVQPVHGVDEVDRLAAAALAASQEGSDAIRALALIQQATEKAPRRGDLAWLHVRLCSAVTGCEPQPLEARLKQLAPGNGIAWVGALERAQRSNDAARESILEALSRSQSIDLYWNSLVWHLALARSEAFRPAQGATPLTDAMTDVVTWLSTLAAPAFQPIAKACRDTAAARTERCIRIADILQRSDTFFAEGVGVGIIERSATPGTPAAEASAERVRVLQYQVQTAGEIVAVQIEREKFAAELIELMQKLKREQDVSLAVIRWAGQSVTPPRG
jgi:hypothetical protein